MTSRLTKCDKFAETSLYTVIVRRTCDTAGNKKPSDTAIASLAFSGTKAFSSALDRQRSLPRIDYIFVEPAVRPLYNGAARFTGFFDFLTANGFHLIAMQGWYRGRNAFKAKWTDPAWRQVGGTCDRMHWVTPD
jgi:hypothetical protein